MRHVIKGSVLVVAMGRVSVHAGGHKACERSQADHAHTARDVARGEAGRAELHEGALTVSLALADGAWPDLSDVYPFADLQPGCGLPAVYLLSDAASNLACCVLQDTMASTMKHIDIPEPPRTPGSS